MEVTMPEEVKFTEEELKQVQTIQQGYTNIQNQFGQLKMAHLRCVYSCEIFVFYRKYNIFVFSKIIE